MAESLHSVTTPAPTAYQANYWPTPYPTPQFDPRNYLPGSPSGNTVHVSARSDADLAKLIQAAENRADVATVYIEGGGSIAKQVTLKHHTVFDNSVYSCDVDGLTDYGVFLIADDLLIEGKGTTIMEPTYHNASGPGIEVFQAAGDSCCSHEGSSHDIAVVGFHIKGRQMVYDGGVRASTLLGNCKHCSAQNNFLEDTGSIGITVGGNGAKGNFAQDCLIWHNKTSGVAAANIAIVNAENVLVVENTVFMTSGIFISGGLPGLKIINNYIFKTGQAAIQMYGGGQGALFQDNRLDSTGGGGSLAIELNQVTGAAFRRNDIFDQPGIAFSTGLGIKDCGKNNVFEKNYSSSAKVEIGPSSQGCR